MISRVFFPALLFASPTVLPIAPRARLLAHARGLQSLTALVSSRNLTRDTSGDGLPDVPAARVTVAWVCTLADVEAATNIAA
jgi:hypothetical protein